MNYLRKKLALLLIFIFSLNSFAAVVTDNDGASFITKAEFDTLKSSFQAQIDSYNKSIDSKIDEAIAAYLAGIKTISLFQVDSLLNSVNKICKDGKKKMAKSWAPTATVEPVGVILLNFTAVSEGGGDVNAHLGGLFIRQGANSGSPRYQLERVAWPADDGTAYKTGTYKLLSHCKYGYYFKGKSNVMEYTFLVTGANMGTNNGTVTKQLNANNFSAQWQFEDAIVKNNYWSIEPSAITFKGYFTNGTITTDGISCPITLGTSYAILSENVYETPIIGQATSTSDNYIWDEELMYNEDMQKEYTVKPYVDQAYQYFNNPSSDSGSVYFQNYCARTLAGHYVDYGFKCNFKKHKTRSFKETELIDYPVSSVIGNSTGIYAGIPLCRIQGTGKLKAKLKFHTIGGTNNVICGFSKQPFPNDNTKYGNDPTLNITTNTFTPEVEHEIFMDVNKGDTIWLKACASGNDTRYVWLESTELELELSQ